MSIVRCISFMAVIAIASEVGIETQTTTALRHERRKKTIAMPVSRIASISVRLTMLDLLFGELRLNVDDAEADLGEATLDLRKRVEHVVRSVDLAAGRGLLHLKEEPGVAADVRVLQARLVAFGDGRDVADANDRVAGRPRIDDPGKRVDTTLIVFDLGARRVGDSRGCRLARARWRRLRTVSRFWMSPRTSIVVWRFGSYAKPPGTR